MKSYSPWVLVMCLVALPALVTGQESAALAPGSAAYLAEALGLMRAEYYRADEVDWPPLYAEAFRRAAGAEEPADTYAAIRWSLAQLSHSFLQLNDAALAREQARMERRGLTPEPADAEPAGVTSPFASRREPGGVGISSGGRLVGHLTVPAFGGGGERGQRYASTLQDAIRELDDAGACGWVVDLRGNGGGNMWPMMVGVGPVLGEGIVGSLEIAGASAGNWFYRDGVAGIDGQEGFIGARLAGAAYALEDRPPVAVLIDGGTGSSGEAIAIAFKGRPDTRFFGEPSYGYSTATDGYRLSDGANLVIAVGVDVDRDGVAYPEDVLPDVTIAAPESATAPDGQRAAALEWLATRTCAR
jgi:hypothetical protein